MELFKEIRIGKFVLRFMPSDNGWMCGITKEMMDGLQEQEDETMVVPLDPTGDMKTAGINVDLLCSEDGEYYQLSWEEAEEIYRAMLNAYKGND